MSGFSPAWLALREPADHAARNREVACAAGSLLTGLEPARILDLGCGTGSNFRGFAGLVPGPQAWTLVDYDATLLAVAKASIVSAPGRNPGRNLTPSRAEAAARAAPITVDFRQADLTRDLDSLLAAPHNLVTAAAFFDLVSQGWIDHFCAALAARRMPLYAVLTYDGTEGWEPAHRLDSAIFAGFHQHQATDKGFGPAAGPAAHRLLKAGLAARGYKVQEAPSPWQLDQTMAALMAQLADGIAAAALEIGAVSAADAEAWRLARHSALACTTGHMDLLAVPG